MLFDVIPDNFFSPLAAPGKIVYWECICRLFSVTSRQLSFGVERDVLVDELQYYFDSAMAADIPEEDLEDTGGMSSRDKANFMLRRLENWGWIYVDTDYSYVQRVNFRDYAIQIIKALLAVSEDRRAEYQGYIYTIYNLTRAGGSNPGLGLLQIVENTDALITGLKSLNANIKKYIDELTRHSTVAEIMDALLNDYYTNVVDKAYHRLLTSDNVAKFRPEIVERLEANSRSARFLNAASREISELREVEPEAARELVLELLHEVIDAFRSMDEILDYLDTDSLYAPVEGRKAFVPQEIQSILPDEKVRGEKREAMWLKLERTLSPDKIAAYVREQLGDRTSMLASELPLAEDDTFIRLIYIRLYGQRKRVGYRLRMGDTVEKDGFRFRDFEIIRKD